MNKFDTTEIGTQIINMKVKEMFAENNYIDLSPVVACALFEERYISADLASPILEIEGILLHFIDLARGYSRKSLTTVSWLWTARWRHCTRG